MRSAEGSTRESGSRTQCTTRTAQSRPATRRSCVAPASWAPANQRASALGRRLRRALLEVERQGIDAVARHPTRSVVEHVSEMASAVPAHYFGSVHPVRVVLAHLNRI